MNAVTAPAVDAAECVAFDPIRDARFDKGEKTPIGDKGLPLASDDIERVTSKLIRRVVRG